MRDVTRDPGAFARRLSRLAGRPKRVLALALLVAAAAAAGASRLSLRTSLVELLPTSDPAVASLERTRARVGDMNLLLVGIRSPDHAANLRYAAALTQHLQGLPPSVCELAAYHLHDLRDFFRRNRWLYVPEWHLEDVRDSLRKAILKRKNPFVVDLADDGADTKDALVASLRADGASADALETRFPNGDFARGDFAWVVALPPGGLLTENAGASLLAAVRAYVADHPPQAFNAAMTVMPAGPVMATLRNREAIEHDIVSVTLACVLVIGLSIIAYFRSLRALPLVVAPALLGALVAFAAAAATFGYLNSSTAFLGSIILGNGINYAIVLLAALRERQRAGDATDDALARAVEQVWRSTLAASLAAAAAYASLAFTGFRGFSQFGVMGAVGSLACWGATFLLLPTLARRLGGGVPKASTPTRPSRLGGLPALVRRRPGALLVGSAALTVVALLGLRHFAHDPFEYDFRKLSTAEDQDPDHKQFESSVHDLFGRWHQPNVLVADSAAQVEPMRRAIRAQDDRVRPYVGKIVAVTDVLPGPPDEQRRKLALLREIRKLATDPGIATLDAETQRQIRENLPPEHLDVLGPESLPALVRRPFTELDGTVGRVLLAYHADGGVSMWDGHELLGFAGVLGTLKLDDGAVIRSSGPPVIFGAMLRAILRDGPRASLLALAAVVLLVGLVMRPFGRAALAAATMLVGVLWMIGGAGLAGVRITFLNFIALPITFGVGIEYAVNLVARLRDEPDPAQAVRSTGSAVALCSWTTIVGYGSLLAARSQALRGFGGLAILGELSCLLAAVVALPALVSWRRRARRDTPASVLPSTTIQSVPTT